jgi:hypothetical protein
VQQLPLLLLHSISEPPQNTKCRPNLQCTNSRLRHIEAQPSKPSGQKQGSDQQGSSHAHLLQRPVPVRMTST